MQRPVQKAPWFCLAILPVLSAVARGEGQPASLPTAPSSVYALPPAPYQVASDTSVWVDETRGRSVPMRVYYPIDDRKKRHPAIVFSHGLGGSREGCAYLGQFWASYGFLSFHPQHQGSDEEVWRGKIRPIRALKSSFEDPTNLEMRVADLRFVLDRLEAHIADRSPLGEMIDGDRIGVAGHAFGSLAALVLAGQDVSSVGPRYAGADERVKAVLAMSSPILFDQNLETTYQDIGVPVLHMTGTKDDSPVGPTRAMHRRIPFDNIGQSDQFLITFIGADHLTFSGHLRDRAAKNDGYYQDRIAAASTAFWLAYLAEETQGKSALTLEEMNRIVGTVGTVEFKSAKDAILNPVLKGRKAASVPTTTQSQPKGPPLRR